MIIRQFLLSCIFTLLHARESQQRMKIAATLLSSIAVASAAGAVLVNHTQPAQLDVVESPQENASASNAPEFTLQCFQPDAAPYYWYRVHRGDGPHKCHIPPLQRRWSMLKSYRDGGIQGVHWKYTDNENDPECLQGWNYHAADGRTLKTYVAGRTTTYGLNRRWCGLPVYHDGGVQGFQWDYCVCEIP